jgi:hypothetical protein
MGTDAMPNCFLSIHHHKGVNKMRIVTRPDFDGVVCAVLLREAEKIDQPIKWVQPGDIQKGLVDVRSGDILANLPYDARCSLWFDHHFTNRIDRPFNGVLKIAPSAAGIIFTYYQGRFENDYAELVRQTDKIDSADLNLDEVLHPEQHPWLLLSMTVFGRVREDEPYWNQLVALLTNPDISKILDHPEVFKRSRQLLVENKKYREILLKHTKVIDHVGIIDLRGFDPVPEGNRFLNYALFPEIAVNVRIRYDREHADRAVISVGHSIFNHACRVNVGLMLKAFEGGGHRGAGACSFDKRKTDDYLAKIIAILLKNEPNESLSSEA